ncbi:MAG: ORF6N domain-containing protein [Planctomycetota bacterium]
MTNHDEPLPDQVPLTAEAIGSRIQVLRGQRVLFDQDLARLYGVPTGSLNQAVERNPDRFPPDFMFPLSRQEVAHLKSQSVISSWGGRRSVVRAFTEQGVAMLSGVLKSPRAAKVNVAIMRAFVQMRRALVDHAELARRVDDLERRVEGHDAKLAAVFEAIRQLLLPPPDGPPGERIGFHPSQD